VSLEVQVTLKFSWNTTTPWNCKRFKAIVQVKIIHFCQN